MENSQQQSIGKITNAGKNISSSVNFIPMFFIVSSFLMLFLNWTANSFNFLNVYISLGVLSIWLLIVFVLSIVSLISKRKIIYSGDLPLKQNT